MNFSTNGAGLDIHSLKKKKKEKTLSHTTYRKIYLSWIKDMNARVKTIKLLE